MTNTSSSSLRSLASFGDVAAEDDKVLDYFFTNEAASKISENQVFLILGRKGAGKTALVRYFAEGSSRKHARSLSLKGYPWNIHAKWADNGCSPIEAYVAAWKYAIVVELASLLLSKLTVHSSKEAKSLKRFLNDNYGGVDLQLEAIIRPKLLKLSKLSFEPQVLGIKLGSLSIERSPKDLELGLHLNSLSDSILSAVKNLAHASDLTSLTLHFDELDQGLTELDLPRKSMLIGLVLAARAIRLSCTDIDCHINPVVYLRTDIWDTLEFSDKNKISQTLTFNLEWDKDSLKKMINARISARLGPTVDWNTIISGKLMRGSQKPWDHILARTFLRPRDVIRFLNAILTEAKRRDENTQLPLTFDSQDITAARSAYSAYLKSELDDEILAHWRYWEEALQACSAISTLTFKKQDFVREYLKRRSDSNHIEPEEALRMLHKFSVIGYELRSGYGGSSWAFQYVDPDSRWDQATNRFKVHLGLKEYAKLREERN